MTKTINKLPGVWGLAATGPAVWAGASMMAAGGLFELVGGEAVYVLAIIGTGSVSLACGVWGFINAKHELEREVDLEARIAVLEAQVRSLNDQSCDSENSVEEELSDNPIVLTTQLEEEKTSCWSSFFSCGSKLREAKFIQENPDYQTFTV